MSNRFLLLRRRGLFAVVLLLLAGGVWYFGFRSPPPRELYPRPAWQGDAEQPPVPVRTVLTERKDLPVHLKAIGTVTPLNTVTVRSRVAGPLLRIEFTEGQQVRAGDLLAVIDPRPYEIRLAQTEAQWRQNLAQLTNARRDLERYQQLHERTLMTQQEMELQRTRVAELEAVAAADQAQVDDAKLQLSYTQIRAPISGRLGLRRVDVGNLIEPGNAEGIVVITQVRPVSVIFTVPENDLQQVLEPLRQGDTLTVEVWDRSERAQLARGVLRTVDNAINVATGTVRMKAEFPNKEERLFPNQFVNIRLRVRTLANAIVIPSAAVQFGSRGTYVYVIDGDNRAAVRELVLGVADGTQQSVVRGLNAGDAVVIEGLDRLREGRRVVLVDSPSPAPASGADVDS
ncbi:MAG TPA: MdtA/MuxA family multidrug efflux RND transporter periplasmic adaptor subunit [Candidatus Synoicihabitans sp.]|nr:MdtA/MuxA family multidrug efflux RND transporter periplasmic adaptor subunit [Candidatus Synoicihabitans sp.]